MLQISADVDLVATDEKGGLPSLIFEALYGRSSPHAASDIRCLVLGAVSKVLNERNELRNSLSRMSRSTSQCYMRCSYPKVEALGQYFVIYVKALLPTKQNKSKGHQGGTLYNSDRGNGRSVCG